MLKNKICFIHATSRDYRYPLFRRLSDCYDIDFLFYKYQEIPEQDSQGLKHEIMKSYPMFGYSIGFCPSIIWKLLKYDTIILSTLDTFTIHMGFLIGKLFRKKVIIWSETWKYPETLLGKISLPYVKFMLRHSDKLIASGSMSRLFMMNNGANKEKISIANNCSCDLAKREEKMFNVQELGLGDKKVILYLGRIIEYKGLDYLIKAFSMLEKERDDIILVIGGDGNFKKDCEFIIEKVYFLKNYRFLGNIDHNIVHEYIDLCDVFVLPAKFMMRQNVCCEAWGLLINEVMSLGKPVITTTAVASGYDLIHNNYNGFVVEERDVVGLYKKMKFILDQNKDNFMGEKSRVMFDNWNNYDKMFEGFREAIER